MVPTSGRGWTRKLSVFRSAAVLFAFAFAMNGSGVHAEITEPDNVIFGTISSLGRPVTAAQTNLVIDARKSTNGPVIASYRMGEDPGLGDFYGLRIPLEAFLPLRQAEASRIGGLIYLMLRDEFGVRAQLMVAIPERGKYLRVDFTDPDSDGDGLPDRWELQYFGNKTIADPNSDPDGDGQSNRAEFLAGTNPLQADGRHPADIFPADNRLSVEELDAYANAWLDGQTWTIAPTNIPIAFVTRAAALWLGGETYRFTNAPPTNSPMWWVNLAPVPGAIPPGTNRVVGQPLPVGPTRGQTLVVGIRSTPRDAVLAYAVEDVPPAGWPVGTVSHGGSYDAVNGRVKWGPFYDAGERDLYYEVSIPTNATGAFSFSGLGSFDGLNVVATGGRVGSVGGSSTNRALRLDVVRVDAQGLLMRLDGQAATAYRVESSTNFVSWQFLRNATTDLGGVIQFRPTNFNVAPHRFYRARVP